MFLSRVNPNSSGSKLCGFVILSVKMLSQRLGIEVSCPIRVDHFLIVCKLVVRTSQVGIRGNLGMYGIGLASCRKKLQTVEASGAATSEEIWTARSDLNLWLDVEDHVEAVVSQHVAQIG